MLCHNPKQLTDAFINYSSREIGVSGLGGMGVQRQEAEGSDLDGKQEAELAPNDERLSARLLVLEVP